MSKEYIPYKDYVPHGEDLARGEQIHVNHDNCPAGVDTKRRLYVKRTDDGHNILAYCHHCGLSGSKRTDDSGYLSAKAGSGMADSREPKVATKLPSDYTTEFGDFSPPARAFCTKNGFRLDELQHYGIGYSHSRNSVILPVVRSKELLGYQERTFTPEKPKYLTRAKTKPLWWYSGYYNHDDTTNGIVIVEDMLSGIKCARIKPTIALLGANMGDKLLVFIMDACKGTKITVFLDDDNRQVKLNQLKIKAQFEQCGYTVKLITGMNKDPKECSDSELERILL